MKPSLRPFMIYHYSILLWLLCITIDDSSILFCIVISLLTFVRNSWLILCGPQIVRNSSDDDAFDHHHDAFDQHQLIWWWCLWPSSWCHWSASTHLMMMSLTIMPLINIRHHQQMCFALFVVQTRYVKSFARIVVHIVNHKSTDVFWIWTTNQQMCFALFMVHIVRGRIQVANVVVFNSNSRDFKKKLPNLYWVGFK